MLRSIAGAAYALIATFAGAAGAEESVQAAKAGGPVFRLCASCHSLQPGVHLSGPGLADLWQKRAGTVADYGRYTNALMKSDIVWDENTLNAWLADPQAMVPGTTMTFRGIPQNETREHLIAFLRRAMVPGGSARVVKDGLIPESMAAGQIPPDLTSPKASQRITQIRHCRDAYHVTTADGTVLPLWETNVRLKTDGSARGPKRGEPVLVRSGMAGDRVSIVFSSLADISRVVAEKC